MKTRIILTLSLLIVSIVAFAQTLDAQTVETAKTVSAEEAVRNALKTGAKMPAFVLNDSNGKPVSSKDLLKEGNLVLVFYRGSWCPFCNVYLHGLQTRLKDITAAGGKLVAISVENPDASTAVAKKNEVMFTVLSDPQLKTARAFGIVYQLPAETDAKYISHGLDVAKHNAMEKPELPLAVTYIINKKSKITYAFLETDYKKRADPDVIIENLKKLKR